MGSREKARTGQTILVYPIRKDERCHKGLVRVGTFVQGRSGIESVSLEIVTHHLRLKSMKCGDEVELVLDPNRFNKTMLCLLDVDLDRGGYYALFLFEGDVITRVQLAPKS